MTPLKGSVRWSQIQGPREYQEDSVLHVPLPGSKRGNAHLIGVFDGHGGAWVARECARKTPELFDGNCEDSAEALRQLIERLDARTRFAQMGTTVSLAHIVESERIVTTAVVGDSPIIVLDDSGALQLSEEHNVRSNQSERDAAIARGGVYQNGYICIEKDGKGLQLSRALGDRALGHLLSRTPTIASYTLGTRSIVAVASDGLIDPDHFTDREQDAVRVVRKLKRGMSPKRLIESQDPKRVHDNTSLIVWRPTRWSRWFA